MFLGTIANFFHEGGPTMYITATAGIIGFTIAFERFGKLYKSYNEDTSLFMARVKELMLQNRLEDALQFANMERHGLLPSIIKSGLERVGCEETLVRQSMESTYLEQIPKVTKNLSFLSLIANAGMLFGLLGTVLGLITQFSAIASVEAGQKQLMMAKGIAEAMNNTALGLMVALPCLVLHGILSARANKILEELERGSSQFMDWIGLYNYGQLEKRLSPSSSSSKKNFKSA